MTKDEAIKIIKTEMECVSRPDCDRLACAYCDLAMRDEDVLTAYQMAVDALQTDGDCISKQTVFDTAAEYENELCEILGENELAEVVKILKHRLIALPSAHPEPCDAISRADAIRVASGYCHPANVAQELAKLPSVQPDNSCDGCRYENADDGVLVPCGFCKRNHPDNYERRTDGTEQP